MNWNPIDWFRNRGGEMEDDFSPDDYPSYADKFGKGGGYSYWDTDMPVSSSSPSFVNQFGKGFLQEYMNNNKSSKGDEGGGISWLGGGNQGGFTTSPIGKSGRNTLVQLHHPQATVIPAAPSQRSGSGIGGLIGSGLGYFVGNAIAPGIGGKIGGSLGGSIGSSF